MTARLGWSRLGVSRTLAYALEELTEEELLEIDREVQIPNASMTTYRRDGDRRTISFADTSAVDQTEVDVIHEEPREAVSVSSGSTHEHP